MPTAGSISSIRKTNTIGLNLFYRYFRSGLYPAPKSPYVLGREGAGIVTKVGEGVTNVQQGDRVAYMGPEVFQIQIINLMDSRTLNSLLSRQSLLLKFQKVFQRRSPLAP
jgi:NADPH:quinone reductase-like Zn-dependent oxidoreductase